MMRNFEVDSSNLESFLNKLEKQIDINKKKIKRLSNSNQTNYKDTLKKLEDLDEELEIIFTQLSHYNSVNNSKKSNEVYEKAIDFLTKYHNFIIQNEALFNKLKTIVPNNKYESRALELQKRDFILNGAELPKDKKRELEEIEIRLSQLANTFNQNLLEATNSYELIIDNEKDLEGLPKDIIQKAKEIRDNKIVYKFTLQAPSYLAYMSYGKNRKIREELYRAYNTRAPQNQEVIDEILRLREKKAKLLGFENYAAYSLATKDAKSQEDVLNFLYLLLKKGKKFAKQEIEELKEFAKKEDNIELESYDILYYIQKLKDKKFKYDENRAKEYFEQNRVLKETLKFIGELFNIEFRENLELKRWHKSVKVFDIYSNNKLNARIYFDLEARENKQSGAWMHDWESYFIDSKDNLHLPSAFVVANFSPATNDIPSLLRHDDIVTLFHELGHALHHLLSKVPVRSISGINSVAWDVVEFPSQFLENFAYEPKILKKFAYHYKTNQPIDEDILEKIKSAKNFMAGYYLLRQLEFALFDFLLHQKLYQKDEVNRLLNYIREETSLIKPPSYVRFEHSFSHIFAGGYAAGYYSYKWAEVLSADAFFECLDNGEFDKEKAIGYKENILSKGASKDMRELYYDWLQKEPKVESLLRLYDMGE
ncbi:MAG: M3 family metallopeptidase [Epsilonproteobacteria bacterium]|nr:M3 family metallopeptidase [Campylobacterota bacterium]